MVRTAGGCGKRTFRVDLKVRAAADEHLARLQARAGGHHFARVARLVLHLHAERRLGDLAAGEPDRHAVLALRRRRVHARVRLLAVLVERHLRLYTQCEH